jgi:hypothetical protein
MIINKRTSAFTQSCLSSQTTVNHRHNSPLQRFARGSIHHQTLIQAPLCSPPRGLFMFISPATRLIWPQKSCLGLGKHQTCQDTELPGGRLKARGGLADELDNQ